MLEIDELRPDDKIVVNGCRCKVLSVQYNHIEVESLDYCNSCKIYVYDIISLEKIYA